MKNNIKKKELQYRNTIITPTYKNHFQFIPRYLESFDKFVEDKKNISIYFIISKIEKNFFQKIIKPYNQNLNIIVLFIEDLFAENNINLTPKEYLKKYGRFTFQTAKKFYSMLHINAEKFLVLDSESMWVKPTNMTQMFEKYFKSPFLITSKIENHYRSAKSFNQMLNNVIYLTGCENKWYIEHFMWFYDKQILVDMFAKIGNLNELINKIAENNKNLDIITDIKYGIFEIVLYYAYLNLYKEKYGYKEINIDEQLKKYLTNELFQNYKKKFYTSYEGTCGIIEHCLMLLDEQNYKPLASMFKDLGLNIIRCDKTDFDNIELQEKFLDIVQPNILAASQEHAFGLNNRYETLINKNNKYSIKLEKHLFQLIHPQKISFQLLIEPFSIIFYGIKYLLQRQETLKKYRSLYDRNK